jgi:hypothetical protein
MALIFDAPLGRTIEGAGFSIFWLRIPLSVIGRVNLSEVDKLKFKSYDL